MPLTEFWAFFSEQLVLEQNTGADASAAWSCMASFLSPLLI